MNKSPIFIVGSPRSGTTLLRMIIDSHSKIAVAPESSFLFRMKKIIWLYGDLNKKNNSENLVKDILSIRRVKDWMPKEAAPQNILEGISKKDFGSIINAVFSSYAESRKKERWGDKTPKNAFSIPEIIKLFPKAKIICMMRDGRDVAMSLKKADFGKVNIAYGAYEWKTYSIMIEEMLKKFPENTIKIYYEDLLSNPEKTVEKIQRFADLPIEKGLLKKYSSHDDDVKHTKSSLYKRSINKENCYKWKKGMRKNEQKIFESIAGEELKKEGYETQYKSKTRIRSSLFICFSQIKRFFNKEYIINYFDISKIIFKQSLRKIFLL